MTLMSARLFGLTLATSVAACLPTISAHAQTSTALEEITVTATRREENLQSVPIAVSALDATMLARRQITETRDMIYNVPNLTGNNNTGLRSATTFFIRGVGTTESISTVDTAVGVYLDDVYIARQAVNNYALLDIDRIEVLRGPQGTLYGRNTSGGAINVISKKPGPDPELSARISYGNYDRWSVRLSASGPIAEDKVFAQASFLTEQGKGTSRNVTLGRDVNDLDYIGARGALRFKPSDTFEYTVAVDGARDETLGVYSTEIGGYVRGVQPDRFVVYSGLLSPNVAKAWGVSGNGTWQFSDNFSLQSITAYRNSRQNFQIDFSDQPDPIYILGTKFDSDQFSQELKVAGSFSDRFKVIAGLYYFYETSDSEIIDDLKTFSPVSPTGARVKLPTFKKVFSNDTTSYAAFGQVDYKIFDTLTLVLGGRYTHDERSIDIVQTAGTTVGFNNAILAARGVDLNPKFNQFTPKVGLDWQVTPDVLAYASYTQGYRAGAWQARVNAVAQFLNFPSEKVNSYEIGVKATLLGGRARWNSSAFTAEYSNLFNSVPGGGNTFLVATADAKMRGLETELTVRVTPWLDVFGNLGLMHTEYKALTPAVDALLGNELQRSPKSQFKVGFSVEYPMDVGGTFLLNGDLFHTAAFFTNPQNDPISKTGPYSLLNATIGYRLPNDRYEISFSCTNCGDKRYFDSILNFPASGFSSVYMGNPRFYKVTLAAKF